MNRPAGFWVRVGASILDGIIIGIPIAIISYLGQAMRRTVDLSYSQSSLHSPCSCRMVRIHSRQENRRRQNR